MVYMLQRNAEENEAARVAHHVRRAIYEPTFDHEVQSIKRALQVVGCSRFITRADNLRSTMSALYFNKAGSTLRQAVPDTIDVLSKISGFREPQIDAAHLVATLYWSVTQDMTEEDEYLAKILLDLGTFPVEGMADPAGRRPKPLWYRVDMSGLKVAV